MKASFALPWLAGVVISVTACATTTANLAPERIPAGDGAFFGRVEVANDETDVTDDCYVDFTDTEGQRKLYVSLADDGWVFGSAKSGPTYLSTVVCRLGGLFRYNATFHPKKLVFEVGSGKTIAYFGHMAIDLHSDGSPVAAGAAAGPAASVLAGTDTGSERYQIQDRRENALTEYRRRYGDRAALLTPVASLATRTKEVAAP